MTDIDKSEKKKIDLFHFLLDGIRQDSEKNYKGAIDNYSKAIGIDPDSAIAYLYRGKSRTGLKQYQDAIDDLSKLLETYPNDVNSLLLRSSAKRKLGNNEGADEDKKKADRLKKYD